MPIVGIGTDIIEIERIKKSAGARFFERLFTQREQDFFHEKKLPCQSIAGSFAAKEAVAKALGIGFSEGITPPEIEILHDSCGKPLVTLHGTARQRLSAIGATHIEISISHCKAYAVAFAVAEGPGTP